MKRDAFVPVTPAGTVCMWLVAETEEKAWENLLRDAAHMPYRGGIAGFMARGYIIAELHAEPERQARDVAGYLRPGSNPAK